MTYVLTAPMAISPRLLPAIRISDAWLSVQPSHDTGTRLYWSVYIDGPEGELYVGEGDIGDPFGTQDGEGARRALSTLCAFLSAEAEAYRATMGATEPEDGWLFNAATAEWCYLNDDEIGSAECDLEGEDA